MVGPLLEEREKWRTPSCPVPAFQEHPLKLRQVTVGLDLAVP